MSREEALQEYTETKTFYCFKKDWDINIFGQQCNSWQSEAFIEMLVVRIFQHGKRNRKTFPQTGR
jgi:hypothetical protein